jgi:hypothetical protein
MNIKKEDITVGCLISRKSLDVDEFTTIGKEIIIVDTIYFDVLQPDIFLINGYPTHFYEPILLTEYWLMRFGFSYSYKYDEWFEYEDNSGIGMLLDYETGSWLMDASEVKYVHQFQILYNISRGQKLILLDEEQE